VLRLLHDTMSEPMALAWDHRLRQAMKALAPSRDQVVTAAVVSAHARALERPADRDCVLQSLPHPRNAPPSALRRIGPLLDDLDRKLGPTLDRCPWAPIDQAFEDSLGCVRRLQAKARHNQTPALWHRWRRRVKALAYQADFVRPPDRPDWKKLRQDAWQLQSKLGALQDLHITLEAVPELKAPRKALKELRRVLRRAAVDAMRSAWQARLKKKSLQKI